MESSLPGKCNDFFCGILHPLRNRELHTRIPEDFLSFFDIGAFQAHDDWYVDANGFGCFHHSVRYDIATHDSAEYIDEGGFDLAVAQEDLECVPDLIHCCATPHIQ